MSATKPISAVQSLVNDLLADLYAKGGCEKIGLSRESLAVILCDVGAKQATATTSESDLRAFFLTIRIDELALARACAAGSDPAWEIFMTRYREKLYLSALRIAREDSAARELADTLYADLYGTNIRDGAARLQACLIHRARIAGGLAAYRFISGICQPLSAHQAPGQSR